MEFLEEVLLDGFIDTLKLIPFLYLAYLLMEYLEHKSSNAASSVLEKSGKFGPFIGATFGIVPQCGFSAAASGLYASRVITIGTLFSIYLATSDEMLPILISNINQVGIPFVLKVLLFKWLCGILFGFLIDFVYHLLHKKEEEAPTIEELCEREHCKCGDHFALSALKHTAKVTLFLFIVNICINTIVFFIGEDQISLFVSNNKFLSEIVCTTIGLVPNCAASLILTDLYIQEVLPLGSMLAGLLVNSGIGLALLIRNNRPFKNTLVIIGLLWLIGFACGILIDFTPIHALF